MVSMRIPILLLLAVSGEASRLEEKVTSVMQGMGSITEDIKMLQEKVDRLEMLPEKVDRLQMLLEKLDRMASKIPEQTAGCFVEVRSWGKGDEQPWIGYIKVNGHVEKNMNYVSGFDELFRGIGVMLLQRNATTGRCDVTGWRLFDSHDQSALPLVEYLEEQAAGTIVAIVTADEPTGRRGSRNTTIPGSNLNDVKPALSDIGVVLHGLEYRSSIAAVAVKGTSNQAIVDIKGHGKGPAKVNHFLP